MTDAALRFAERLTGAADEAAVFRLYEQAVGPFGYCSVDYYSGVYDTWPVRAAPDWHIDDCRATFDWEAEYIGTDFQRFDRTIPFATQQLVPWLYWDLWNRPHDHPVQRKMEARVQDRVRSGLGVPLHDYNRFTGCHMGSLLTPAELERASREHRAVVFLLASMFHGEMRRRRLARPIAMGAARLSARERECLLWAARGKTAWETSMILHLSESAIKKLLQAASSKLRAATRTQAVALAILYGLIDP